MRRYRTFWPRFWAGFIDGLVLLPVNILAGALSGPEGSAIAGGVLGAVAPVLYSILMHAARGQTVGKMATGVVVMDLEEKRTPTLGEAIARDIGNIFFAAASIWLIADLGSARIRGDDLGGAGLALGWLAIAWFLIELVTMLTNPKRRALHDFIAGTVVIRVDRGR